MSLYPEDKEEPRIRVPLVLWYFFGARQDMPCTVGHDSLKEAVFLLLPVQ